MAELYQARFARSAPSVAVKDGVVTIRYPRRLLGLGGEQREAEIRLNVAIPWQIAIQGGAAEVEARLGGLKLAGVEVKGGLSTPRLELPVPSEVVPIRIPWGSISDHHSTPRRSRGTSSPRRAGPQNLSSTSKPSAMWATTCGCKALALIRQPRTTTAKLPVPLAWSPSPPVDASRRATAQLKDIEVVHLRLLR
jgi:hypothetical protein